ncbi:MAG: GNAT family N-acetyltransferase [Oscillatoria sp. SIO1A7]|nr:GNAT family N-acetyltransferase [Oscillatoria sp. SIO1A7]
MNSYSFKRSFSEEPRLIDRLLDLAEIALFPGITEVAERSRELGASWEDASTPFIYFQDDLAITHVGVLEIPIILMGKPAIAGGIHGVCTHPDFRRRGYYRKVMEEVLDYCANRYETLVLTTDRPEYYYSFGFHVVQESACAISRISPGGSEGFRLLDFDRAEDKQILHRLLAERQPISNIVGIRGGEKAIFCFNEGSNPLYYAPDLDLMVSMEIDKTTLKLFDLVGTKGYNLDEILERIPQAIEEVKVYFACDRLAPEAPSFPNVLDGNSLLMVRGPFPAEGHPFTMPRSTRC